MTEPRDIPSPADTTPIIEDPSTSPDLDVIPSGSALERMSAAIVEAAAAFQASRKVAVTVELAPLDVLLLDATATHLGKTRAEVVAEALRCFFIVLPRPGDASSRGAP